MFREQNKKSEPTESASSTKATSGLDLDFEQALEASDTTQAPEEPITLDVSVPSTDNSLEQALDFAIAETQTIDETISTPPKTQTEDAPLNFEFSLDLDTPTDPAPSQKAAPIATVDTADNALDFSLDLIDKPTHTTPVDDGLAFEVPHAEHKETAGEDILLTEASLALASNHEDLTLDLDSGTEATTVTLEQDTPTDSIALELTQPSSVEDDFELLLAREEAVQPDSPTSKMVEKGAPAITEATPAAESTTPKLKVVVTPQPQAEPVSSIPPTSITLTPPTDAVGFSNVSALSQTPAAASNKNKIMIVDDSKVVRIKTSRVLSAAGFEVVTAEDGMDALRNIKENGLPDVMITDIEMPNLDGMKLTEVIRRHPKTSTLPIVMITSHTEAHKAQAALLNVNVFLSKPYADADLVQHIQSLAKQTA